MRVEEAASEAEALDKIASREETGESFRVIITDQTLPEVDGITLCRRIRRQYHPGGPALLLLSSLTSNAPSRGATATGTDALLSRPYRAEVLRRTLLNLVESGTAARSPNKVSIDAARQAVPKISGDPVFEGRRVLVVEDNSVNQKVAATVLRNLGCEVEVARNGSMALELVRQAAFDLVLMDCQMPEMDGFEATIAIRREEGHGKRLPIVALTAAAMEQDHQRCIACGMDGYLSKPVQADVLREYLREWLAER
jgi:CheY-like chemotaxis protein